MPGYDWQSRLDWRRELCVASRLDGRRVAVQNRDDSDYSSTTDINVQELYTSSISAVYHHLP